MFMANNTILQTKSLRKTFKGRGKDKTPVEAVRGIDLEVIQGELFGFLGPNGAGKTTTLQMLTTLLAPTSGKATVVGYDLLAQPQKIREHIGYVSQAGGTDMSANAIDNLVLQAQLYGMSKDKARKRADDLIERFEIAEFATRVATSYSGGQKRRLDLALGVIHQPQLLFLDEPTTGLDPQSRAHFWDEIKGIKKDGTTIFLTTHYLDEADNLCDRLAIVDHGTVVATGTPSELKKKSGGESIIVGFPTEKELKKGAELMKTKKFVDKQYQDELQLHLYVTGGEKLLPDVLRLLDQNKIKIQTIELSKPSLDDVFLQQTGRSLREGGES
jgi:ABC-2 type transport system ATP-binding protein